MLLNVLIVCWGTSFFKMALCPHRRVTGWRVFCRLFSQDRRRVVGSAHLLFQGRKLKHRTQIMPRGCQSDGVRQPVITSYVRKCSHVLRKLFERVIYKLPATSHGGTSLKGLQVALKMWLHSASWGFLGKLMMFCVCVCFFFITLRIWMELQPGPFGHLGETGGAWCGSKVRSSASRRPAAHIKPRPPTQRVAMQTQG